MTCRELFDACRNGDLNSVKALATQLNVNARDITGRRSTPLHFAAGFGRRDIVEHLVSLGAELDARDEGGLNPLHNACSFGHAEVARLLLANGSDPNVTDSWDFTPLHEAASKGKIDVCIVLLQNGADPTKRNADTKTPVDIAETTAKLVLTGEFRKEELLEASRSGNEEVLMSLLTPLSVNCHASDGRKSTPLHLAAGYNRIRVVQLLLQHGADVHAKDKGGLVPLHNACSYGHLEVSELLIKQEANVNATDLWQFTPLHEAASKGRAEVCSCLLAHGADPTLKNCNTKTAIDLAPTPELQQLLLREYRGYSLLDACKQGDTSRARKAIASDIVNFKHAYTGDAAIHVIASAIHVKKKQLLDMLLKKNVNLNEKNKELLTALHIAADRNQTELLELLLRHGAKANALDGGGNTALHRCAAEGRLESARVLLRFDIDPSIMNLQGKQAKDVASTEAVRALLEEEETTANAAVADRRTLELQLLEAAKSGDIEIVNRLVLNNRTPQELVNCCDSEGRRSTPLHFAAGYNRIEVVQFLLEQGADVHAKDKGGLVPLHNACSYGHYEVTELLVQYGADVNVADLWKFTPLHEAAAKGKFDICKLLIKHGADTERKNRDGATPMQLTRESDDDVQDLLRGDVAFLEHAKKGDLEKVRKLLTAENVNCRDITGRNSTPLHLAAGYNNLEVAAYLLEQGASVNAQDKGGLIPLHNASSYGHLEIASLLIEHGANVMSADRWGFTPLHEAAQKGRTQLCALLVSHGADPRLQNQESQTPLDLAASEDVISLLRDAIASSGGQTCVLITPPQSSSRSDDSATEADDDKSGSDVTPPVPPPSPNSNASPGQSDGSAPIQSAVRNDDDSTPDADAETRQSGSNLVVPVAVTASGSGAALTGDGSVVGPTSSQQADHNRRTARALLQQERDKPLHEMSVPLFLKSIGLEVYRDLFAKEQITLDILLEMSHDDLKAIGLDAYGVRHKLLKSVQKLTLGQPAGCSMPGFPATPPGFQGTVLVDLANDHPEFLAVEDEMQSTIAEHKDGGAAGGIFSRYRLLKIQKIYNRRLWERYIRRRDEVADENDSQHNEKFLFHGSSFLNAIVQKGFDERHAYIGGMFGAGIYFAEHSSKSNQYVYGIGGGTGCPPHKDKSCYVCHRQLLLCRVVLGKSFLQFVPMKMAHAPPGHHSIVGRPTKGGLVFPEYVIYRGEQAYPEYLITYQIVQPESPSHEHGDGST
jgi:tankyrase